MNFFTFSGSDRDSSFVTLVVSELDIDIEIALEIASGILLNRYHVVSPETFAG